MYKARKNVETKGAKRDIIEEYANFGSTVYAPITRDGLSLDKKANKYEVQPEALSSYAGLNELHEVLAVKKPKVFNSKISVDKVRFNFRKNISRKDVDHMKALGKAQGYIDTFNEQLKNEKEAADKHEDVFDKIKMRGKSPVFRYANAGATAEELEEDDKRRRAIVLLQRLLRGRAQ